MAPMKLYGATVSWNVTRCVVALEEAGAEYQIVPIDFATAEHKSPEHLARNPFGQVPAFQDGDLHLWGTYATHMILYLLVSLCKYDSIVVFTPAIIYIYIYMHHKNGMFFLPESRAICKYVARKNKAAELLREGNLQESAMVDVWLEVESNQYTAALNPILYECLVSPMFGGTTDQKVVEENLEKLKKVLEVYEARLAKHKYLAGDFLSLADLNHVSVTLCLLATPHASVLNAYPHVKAWWDGLMARPSVQKVAALMKPSA
ncbi:hypothetical protein SORBI_3001G012500 [Sorghum bicolor]|uniref:glutathione transferase n=1 Tax=Sorghum bicolor TaxID=4558 RepID=A0A1B6QGT8_SORBI|nr:hypothetical protein SORBI_3001G012500 [Sorghum bicolor]